MPNNRPGWGAFLPRYNIPETFGTAISYEGQLHWFLENWNEVAEYANALEQPTITAGSIAMIDDNNAQAYVRNSGSNINAVFDFGLPMIYPRLADPFEWSRDRSYPTLTVVGDGSGNSYTSRREVPAGTDLSDRDYWASTGIFDAYVMTLENDLTYIERRAIRAFPTVAAMEADEYMSAGIVCHVLGRFAPGDGGDSTWIISASGGEPNGMDILSVAGGGLTASIVSDGSLCPVALGAASGADSSAIFQRIIAMGAAIDGRGGEYVIASPLTPPADTFSMRDCSINLSGTCPGLFARASSDFYAPAAVTSEYVDISNCEFFGAVDAVAASVSDRSYSAALPITARHVTVRDCVIHDNGCNGLVLYADTSDNTLFESCEISSCEAYSNGLRDSGGNLVKTGIGIGAYIRANDIPSNATVTACDAHDNASSGIAMHGVGTVSYVACTSHDNGEHGFVFQTNRHGSASGCHAARNVSRGFRIQGDWSNATDSYCEDVTITGCTTERGRACNIGGGVRNVVISGNILDVGQSSGRVFDFDPHQYPDSNIMIRGNVMAVTATETIPYPRVLATPCTVDHDVYIVDNVFNGVFEDYSGYVIRDTEGSGIDTLIIGCKPKYPGRAYESRIGSLVGSVGTLTGDTFTSNGSNGSVRSDVVIGDAGLLIVYVNATPLVLAASEGTGYLRMNVRDASGSYLADLGRASTVQYADVVGNMGTWCAMLDLNKVREAYPDAGIIRPFFYMPHAGDQVRIDAYDVCLV